MTQVIMLEGAKFLEHSQTPSQSHRTQLLLLLRFEFEWHETHGPSNGPLRLRSHVDCRCGRLWTK